MLTQRSSWPSRSCWRLLVFELSSIRLCCQEDSLQASKLKIRESRLKNDTRCQEQQQRSKTTGSLTDGHKAIDTQSPIHSFPRERTNERTTVHTSRHRHHTQQSLCPRPRVRSEARVREIALVEIPLSLPPILSPLLDSEKEPKQRLIQRMSPILSWWDDCLAHGEKAIFAEKWAVETTSSIGRRLSSVRETRKGKKRLPIVVVFLSYLPSRYRFYLLRLTFSTPSTICSLSSSPSGPLLDHNRANKSRLLDRLPLLREWLRREGRL